MSEQTEMITGIEVPIYLQYNFTAGRAPSKFLAQPQEGRVNRAALSQLCQCLHSTAGILPRLRRPYRGRGVAVR